MLVRRHAGHAAVGEILAPRALSPLHQLGVWDRFLALGSLPVPGMICVWGEPRPYEVDFILSPSGNGWHIERAQFDQMLLEASEEAGAYIARTGPVQSCRHDGNQWLLEAAGGLRPVTVRATNLIGATGRGSPPAYTENARRWVDELVGVVAFLDGSRRSDSDPRALVEACEHGWWYTAPLPDGRVITALMTDRPLLRPLAARSPEGWRNLLRAAPHLWERVADLPLLCPPRTVAANTYLRAPVAGPQYLLTGDAAMTIDPLSGQGITHALEGGCTAARALLSYEAGDRNALRDYAGGMCRLFTASIRARSEYYIREGRWPDAPFWRVRRSAPAPDGTGEIKI